MRIEISAGGIGYGTSVMEFSSVFDGFLSNMDSVISCFKRMKNYLIKQEIINLQNTQDLSIKDAEIFICLQILL